MIRDGVGSRLIVIRLKSSIVSLLTIFGLLFLWACSSRWQTLGRLQRSWRGASVVENGRMLCFEVKHTKHESSVKHDDVNMEHGIVIRM